MKNEVEMEIEKLFQNKQKGGNKKEGGVDLTPFLSALILLGTKLSTMKDKKGKPVLSSVFKKATRKSSKKTDSKRNSPRKSRKGMSGGFFDIEEDFAEMKKKGGEDKLFVENTQNVSKQVSEQASEQVSKQASEQEPKTSMQLSNNSTTGGGSRKSSTKKSAPKKPVTKKTPSKKTPSKKTPSKKPATKKPATKKSATKKSATKK